MKNLFIFVVITFFSSCVNKDGMTSDSFRDVSGILYYEKPETGSLVYIVFLPFAEKNENLSFKTLNSRDYKNGIKFVTANYLIKDKLYTAKQQKLILKGGIDRTVYLLSKTKIYFHIERSASVGNDVIEKDLKVDTLVYMNKYINVKYRFCEIELDSIKTD